MDNNRKLKMKKFSTAGKKEGGHQGLLKLVFSWPINDVLDNNLYKNKINQITDVFSSADHYFNSFKLPLIEETRAEYCCGLESVGHAPSCEISKIWISSNYRPRKDLYYDISTKMLSDVDNHGCIHYEPESGDLFAITNVRPRSIGDLIRPDKPLHLAFVSRSSDSNESNGGECKIKILSSEKIDREILIRKDERLFVTYLTNITTNMRIWTALHPNPRSKNLGLIQKVLQYNSSVDDDCALCTSEESYNDKVSKILDCISSFGLDESQRRAVASSICLRKCLHQDYTVKQSWGPPGTGKTKTVASLLFVLLKQKICRTLTCAPTNVAVIQAAKRLVMLFLESQNYDTYGLGDIILFGNEKRMKIDDHFELVDVFLNYRVELIQGCLSRLTGWKPTLEAMLYFLKDPQARYNAYLVTNGKADNDIDKKAGGNVEASNSKKVEGARTNPKVCKKFIDQTVRNNEEKNKKGKRNGQGKKSKEDSKEGNDHEAEVEEFMSYDEFVRKQFCSLADRLVLYAETFYTHLPTSFLAPLVAKQMIQLADLLNIALESARKNVSQFSQLFKMKRGEILAVLKFLHDVFPELKIDGSIKDFCLDNARLMFCSASGAIKVKSYVDMVVIDEAAQLKECESAISLQIPGLRTAILIGDDRQLPAMVRSKALEKTNFGRSLFQRLAWLGKKKHLLNIQYRMHPSISSFPNKEFYENKIVDAPNVKERKYVKNFLKGGMYGSYSFINVSNGMENIKKGHSPRNFEEAAVVERIVAKLFKDYYCIAKQKLSVGVISPYKGQVGLLQEKIEKKYTQYKETFCINICSVDGFQGGEADIIIISTVRSNRNGSVGFLSSCQRTNVALTRARFCLWIVGCGRTLGNSRSVWENLVLDAKTRGCFYNAYDDIDIDPLIPKSCFFGHLKLDKAKWKVIFNRDFRISISSLSVKAQIRVKEVLHKIADGWRQFNPVKPENVINDPMSFALLELYKVDENLNLAWTVDILKEESCYTQVIKVWDIVPASKIPNLAKNLVISFRGYTAELKKCCEYKSFEGNLVVPMSWPLDCNYNSAPLLAITPSCLSKKLAAMNLEVKQEEPSLKK